MKILLKILNKLKKIDITGLNEYIEVFAGYYKQEKIDTLILGSSHFRYGYIAQKYEYNLSAASQDLYYSYNIYEKFNNSDIKTIILGYSYFAPFHVLVKTGFAKVCIVPKIILDIDYQYPQNAEEKSLYELESKYREYIQDEYEIKLKKLPHNYKGIINYYRKKYKKPNDIIINSIKNSFNREHSQIQYLKKILECTKKNSQNLYIVLPPYSRDFITNYNEEYSKIYQELTNILKDYDHVKLLDFYKDKDFRVDDFDDIVHLSFKGAKKLTEKIHQYM